MSLPRHRTCFKPAVIGKVRGAFQSIPRRTEKLVKTALPFHASAWKSASEPIEQLLSCADAVERDRLTKLWVDGTFSQLHVICVTSALMGAVIASAFTWPILADSKSSDQSTVVGIWYCAILLAVTSIASASQQAVFLSRINTYSNGMERVRSMLGERRGNQWKIRKLQLCIWQTPVMLQNGSIYVFVAGLIALVWVSMRENWSLDQVKIVVLFALTLTFSVGSYLITTVGLYHN